jgi:RNA polymerase sigma-70 factor (ECF subfamily)
MRDRHLPDPSMALTLAEFTALVDRHQHSLFVFLHGLLGEAEQAFDLTQDAFHDAWKAARRGAPPFDAGRCDDERRRWLFAAAYHRAVSALRHRALIRWESLDDLCTQEGMQPESHSPAFEDQIAEGEALRAALTRLSPEDSACLLLRVVQGFSAQEVGEIVGASPAVVTKRLSRAKQRLRVAYLAREPLPEEQRR